MENNYLGIGNRQKELQKSRMSSCFNQPKEVEIEKGGVGSKGGKVIGYTKSGKPIYESHEQENTQHFTSEDHSDAMSAHMKAAKRGGDKSQHHSSMAQLHNNAMNSKLDKESK